MDEYSSDSDIAHIMPDPAGAILAINLASEMLDRAREHFIRRNYDGTLEESRNVMRLASSALLLKDGCIAASFESTAFYLSQYYCGKFPLHTWYLTETALAGRKGGVYGFLAGVLGRATANREQDATDAMNAANSFLDVVRREISL